MKNYMYERYRYYFGIRPIIPSDGNREIAIASAVAGSIAVGNTYASRIAFRYAGAADATAINPVVGTITDIVETLRSDDSDKGHEVSGDLKRCREVHEDFVEADSKKARVSEPDHVEVEAFESKESEQSNSESLKNSSSAESGESELSQKSEDKRVSEENFNWFGDGEFSLLTHVPVFSDIFRFN